MVRQLRLGMVPVMVLWLSAPPASAQAAEVDVAGYFRVAGRPDVQGGNGRLGYWNLYGRLLNESSYGLVDLRVALADSSRADRRPWATVNARIEGGSIAFADSGNGRLDRFRLSQIYVRAGNVAIPEVIWQVGTLEWYYGDLGLYDMRTASLFSESVGITGRLDRPHLELIAGIGDAGFALRPDAYNPILTPGAGFRSRFSHFEFGGGAEAYMEPSVAGKRSALYATPGIAMEDLLRGEVVERYLEENPGEESLFPDPEPRSATSWKAVAYLGFGRLGPLKWCNAFASVRQLHPERMTSETYNGRRYDLFLADLTDQRTVLNLGHQAEFRVIPDRFDLAWGSMYGDHRDGDNDLTPSDHARWYASTVIRGQVYVSPTFHLLGEGSVAREVSRNGNQYRNHADSIFANTDGLPDTRGLENGDADTRDTAQLKGGVVFNPLGTGIFNRPSLRVLYGWQRSTQNNAFGNDFVETLDQLNDFGNVERHHHHLVSLETEVWF